MHSCEQYCGHAVCQFTDSRQTSTATLHRKCPTSINLSLFCDEACRQELSLGGSTKSIQVGEILTSHGFVGNLCPSGQQFHKLSASIMNADRHLMKGMPDTRHTYHVQLEIQQPDHGAISTQMWEQGDHDKAVSV